MGDKTLIYKQKLNDNLSECYRHLERLEDAFTELMKDFDFPIDEEDFKKVVADKYKLALSDQVIYRFSKLQDAMGAKLFKLFLLYQGENIDRPFIDILNELEKLNILDVEKWFELRDLRNEISHDYDNDDSISVNILNAIYLNKTVLKGILDSIKL